MSKLKRLPGHDTTACLKETRTAAASHTHGMFVWCCPKCFGKGVTEWKKKKVAPKRKAPTKRKRG